MRKKPLLGLGGAPAITDRKASSTTGTELIYLPYSATVVLCEKPRRRIVTCLGSRGPKMPSKEDRKKQKRRLKEKKRASDQRRRLAMLEHANRFPQITIDTNGGDPELIKEVERLVSAFSFENPDCCDEDLLQHYSLIASEGLDSYTRHLARQVASQTPDKRMSEAILESQLVATHCHFGEWLFKHLPARFTDSPPPHYFFRTAIVDRSIQVRFDLLESIGEPHNPLFVLPQKATVVMQGASWQVGLYRHALESLCRRLHIDGEPTFTRNMHLYFVLTQSMLAYTPVALADGNEALRAEFVMPLTTAHHDYYARYTRRILGLDDDHCFTEKDELVTVLGYLPLLIQGRYARAKTFLLPGFSKTPEHALVRRSKLSPSERVLLEAMTDETQRTADIAGATTEAIKWYHDNGVPQIFPRNALRTS